MSSEVRNASRYGLDSSTLRASESMTSICSPSRALDLPTPKESQGIMARSNARLHYHTSRGTLR